MTTVTLAVKADTSQATAALNALATLAQGVTAPKAGWRTTEFWASTVAPLLLTLATFLFHRDFSGYVQAAALAAAGISTAAYAVSRAHLKRPTDLAALRYDVKALLPVGKEASASAAAVQAAAPKAAPPATP